MLGIFEFGKCCILFFVYEVIYNGERYYEVLRKEVSLFLLNFVFFEVI